MKPYEFHPEASAELDEAIERYDDDEYGLGRRFVRQVEETIDRVRSGIFGGSPWIRGTRLQSVNRFSYGIVFREFENRIYILAVYHFSRREDYWTHRLEDVDD